MNKRTITWLLAALLAISANAAVPVVRVRTGSGEASIVWIAQDRAEQRVLLPPRVPETHARRLLPLNYEPPAQSRYFATSLYQRPPPSLR